MNLHFIFHFYFSYSTVHLFRIFIITSRLSLFCAMAASSLKEVTSSKCFDGYQKVFSHYSIALNCQMRFSIYLPSQAETTKLPVLYFLSGLTCTEQNFILKSGFQKYAAQYGIIVVGPDTSPRGCKMPEDDDKWNIGSGAGYYINATRSPWNENFNMYSYVLEELPELIKNNFSVLPDKQSIMGHSMGGHGALICTMRNPGKFKSVSAFAPICDTIKCDPSKEGMKILLVGSPDDGSWDDWCATKLALKYSGPELDILIDQGTKDEYFQQLYPIEFENICKKAGIPIRMNIHEGYDHGYYFISTFIENHFAHHAKYLK